MKKFQILINYVICSYLIIENDSFASSARMGFVISDQSNNLNAYVQASTNIQEHRKKEQKYRASSAQNRDTDHQDMYNTDRQGEDFDNVVDYQGLRRNTERNYCNIPNNLPINRDKDKMPYYNSNPVFYKTYDSNQKPLYYFYDNEKLVFLSVTYDDNQKLMYYFYDNNKKPRFFYLMYDINRNEILSPIEVDMEHANKKYQTGYYRSNQVPPAPKIKTFVPNGQQNLYYSADSSPNQIYHYSQQMQDNYLHKTTTRAGYYPQKGAPQQVQRQLDIVNSRIIYDDAKDPNIQYQNEQYKCDESDEIKNLQERKAFLMSELEKINQQEQQIISKLKQKFLHIADELKSTSINQDSYLDIADNATINHRLYDWMSESAKSIIFEYRSLKECLERGDKSFMHSFREKYFANSGTNDYRRNTNCDYDEKKKQ